MYLIDWHRDGRVGEESLEKPFHEVSTRRNKSYDFAFLKIHYSPSKLNRSLATSL